ncbi:MAG TPA: exonuclease domain-containing protein [Gaiellaceae bacterium]|nr:exonuclease domain-containing protein [Gaiellaceae bacterium]
MQLRLDAADRLVELVEERRGPVAADEAARVVLRLGAAVPVGLARSLLAEAVAADARLRWAGDLVALAGAPGENLPLERATYVVFDLETTGLRPGSARPCEIGAVRVRELELAERFQTLANPGARLQPAVAALTGLRDDELRRAPPVAAAVRRFLAFAGDAVLVAHNARFDMAFLDEETVRATGSRVAATVLDTVALARTLLGRQPANLASLAYRFATDARPCHRALPDAEATAEILLRLIGLAQERGARSVGDLVELAATRPRRVQRKRNLAFGAPQRPGVYLFRDAHDQVLYVGKARDLRARLRSYFRSERQRPAVEGALGALAHIEWRVLGSELEAALEELRLIRELRPPANARATRPDRYLYLRRRGDSVVCSAAPTELGPLRSRRRAQLAARALQSVEWETLDDALAKLRTKLRRLAGDLRFEDAGRLRDRIEALEDVVREVRRIERLRGLSVCVVVPGVDEGTRRAFFVAKGQVVCVRPFHGAQGIEWRAGLAAVARAEPTLAPEAADELLAVASFLRRPPPELEVVPLAHSTAWKSFASAPPARAGASSSSTA